ncbi:aldehyde ferredoxin oxidoreductase family protein [Chloroflexota bacterium]
MSKLGGYAGKILEIDLTTRSMNEIPLSEDLAEKFIGGKGLNAWFAYNSIKPHTPPLSPENVLVFGAGPLAGTLAPAGGKTSFASKSPLSQFIGTSNSGHIGMLKYAGYDHLIITGQADSPVYLELGDEVKIRDADHLWGKDTWETTDAIWKEFGRHYAVASIGPAGENLVRDASIVGNKYSLFAKTGMGAVMGSKKLKAIATGGNKGISIAEPKRFMKLANQMCKNIMNNPLTPYWSKWGTASFVENMIDGAFIPQTYQNAKERAGDREVLGQFSLNDLEDVLERHGHIACLACPIGCKHSFRLKKGTPHEGLSLGVSCAGAPFSTFGCVADVGNWSEALRCQELANRLGMDNATAGLAAWAIELYEKGIINKEDTGGMELDWKASVVEELLVKMAHRDGFGDILADGCIEGPRRLGRGSEYYALHYKGIPNSTGDLRPLLNTWALSLITCVIGHAPGGTFLYELPIDYLPIKLGELGVPEDVIKQVVSHREQDDIGWQNRCGEDIAYALNSLGVCVFEMMQAASLNAWAELYTAATGIEMDTKGLLAAASRGTDIEKAFNIREGASRKDDTIPDRFLKESISVSGETKPPIDRAFLDKLVTDYYTARGWDPQDGTLSPDRLRELGLVS